MKDDMIVDLYINRDKQALIESSNKYGDKLKRISFNILQSLADAEECENDTYLSAWNAIPPASPKEYLFSFFAKITRNISINLYNKNNAKKRSANVVELTKEMEECIPNPNDNKCKIEDNDLKEYINSFLNSIPKVERNIFVKRYWFGDSIKELAAEFNFTESKVKSMLMRTRNKLKKYFEDKGVLL